MYLGPIVQNIVSSTKSSQGFLKYSAQKTKYASIWKLLLFFWQKNGSVFAYYTFENLMSNADISFKQLGPGILKSGPSCSKHC